MNRGDFQTQCEALQRTLYGACRHGAQRRVPRRAQHFVRKFDKFVSENPQALEWRDQYTGRTLLRTLFGYLAYAIERKFPLETLRALVIRAPQVLVEKGWSESTLLHLVCLHNPSAVDIVSFFVEQNPDVAKVTDDTDQRPLDIACQENAPLPVIRALVDGYPRAIQICNNKSGSSLVHFVCCNGSPLDVIQYLAIQGPHVCLQRNWEGDLPLDAAKKPRCQGYDAVIEFMTTATVATSRALMKRLVFRGTLPPEVFERAAAYLYGGGAASSSAVTLALSAGEIAVLFRRDDVRAESRDGQV